MTVGTSGGSGGDRRPPVAWWHPARGTGAALVFLAATLAWTWPAARAMTRDFPWDLGDSLLVTWLLGWNAAHLTRAVHGDLAALGEIFHANIFHPAPYVLGYSETFFAQTLQILPVYWLTGNLTLCYNLLYLSTFVLAGLGMYLWVRELTGDWRAAIVAGLIYAFVPYRVAQSTHLQVLSSQWMPFALFGLRRYFATARLSALAGASAALVAQNLSCGYFMLYFGIFVPAYVLCELAMRRQLLDLTRWRQLTVAAALVAALTIPTYHAHVQLKAMGENQRTEVEVAFYAADVYSYLTSSDVRLWGGRMRVFDKPEGQLFPGLLPVLLAAVALGVHVRGLLRQPPTPPAPRPAWTKYLLRAAQAGTIAFGAAVVYVIGTGGGQLGVGAASITVKSLSRILQEAVLPAAALVWLSPRVRQLLRGRPGSLIGFFTLAMVLAWYLSLGIRPTTLGQPLLGPDLYGLLYRYVPGFGGLRVPARFSMVVYVFLSTLAGFGAAWLMTRTARPTALCALLGILFLGESTAAPITTNAPDDTPTVRVPLRVSPTSSPPPLYRFVATLPDDTVLIEFPFGVVPMELRYMYYSTTHWKRLVNGYSGGFPPSYTILLNQLPEAPDGADTWRVLQDTGATHVIVHENVYRDDRGLRLSAWLQQQGATLIRHFPGANVFALPLEGRRRSGP